MSDPLRPRLNRQILEEASAWLVEVNEGPLDAPAREAFNRWMRSSPEHVRAYLEATAVWENAALIDKHRRQDTAALIEMASSGANVIALGAQGTKAASSETGGARKTRPIRFAIAASILIALVGVTWATWWVRTSASTYVTQVGEQRSVSLADGSEVTLNSDSRIRFAFDERERRVELLQGQALFNATQDPKRPFTVYSNQTRVTAIGTRFDVDRRKSGTVVTVLDGRVAVAHAANVPGTVLSAGDQISVDTRVTRPHHVDLAAATAWTQRRLVFSSTPLPEVAESYNRYHTRRLVVRDPHLASFAISGTFSSSDSASLIDFLETQPGIDVHQTDSAIEVTAK